MSDITEKEVLKDALAIWIWLFKNPGQRKEDFPGFGDLNEKYDYEDCPLCYYYYDHNSLSCGGCPLLRENGRSCPEYTTWVRLKHNHKPAAGAIASKIRRRLKKVGEL